jgi:gamma-butyrobetaine dioxygenase
MTSVTVDPTGDQLVVHLANGACRFHAIWLRDNASDAATRAPGNGQRLIALRDIPTETHITRADVKGDVLEVSFATESKKIAYDLGWLEAHAYDQAPALRRGWTGPDLTLWDAGLMGDLPVADFADLSRDAGARRRWLGHVTR